MNNLSLIGKLIELFNGLSEDLDKTLTITIAVGVFILLNFIASIANIIIQFRLKDKEKEIYRAQLREKNRLRLQEKLYKKLEELTYFTPSTGKEEKNQYLSKLEEINSYVTQNKLYLSNKFIKIATEFTDYFNRVLADPRKKSFEKEIEILDKFIIEFNS